ncbi:MAG: hypothetical protein LBR72_09025 [Oscillospiraceae bacterium]|jgi:hypothetical protein|nr:hypothetical protein [Oscillospiraceae bacterium]
MVTVIAGLKGHGKTKQLISLCNSASGKSSGAVVCIERGQKLKYDINHGARLIDTIPYDIRSYQVLRGFITGLYAGNYDISEIFIDSLYKVSGNSDSQECEKFLHWCDTFGAENGVNFTITISVGDEDITEGMRKYMTAAPNAEC